VIPKGGSAEGVKTTTINLHHSWTVSPRITPQASEALIAFPPILRQILFNRGMGTDAEARAANVGGEVLCKVF